MGISKIYQVEEEQFRKVISESSNISQVLRALNLSVGQAMYNIVKRRCDELKIDTAHFSSRPGVTIRANISDNQLKAACEESVSKLGTLKKLGLNSSGANNAWINKKITELDVNTSHWKGQSHLKGKSHFCSHRRSLKEILVKNSSYTSSYNLKNRLIKAGILEYKCYECGIHKWRGKPLSLHLEHKNGISNDNRLENITILCPNCHSQTPTYAGRNITRACGETGSTRRSQKPVL